MYILVLVFALLWLPAFVDVTKIVRHARLRERNRKGLETLDRLHDPAVVCSSWPESCPPR
jgi:hypothetical protein